MAEFPSLPLFVDAFRNDTHWMPRATRGLYLDLLMLMWGQPECRVPNDLDWIARRLVCSEDERDALAMLLREFCDTTGNWITQKRLKKEFNFLRDRKQKQSDRAKSRWDKDKESCRGIAPAEERHSHGNATAMPNARAGMTRGPDAGARPDFSTVPDKPLENNDIDVCRGNAPTPTPIPIKKDNPPYSPPLPGFDSPHPSDEGPKTAVGRKGGASRGSRLPSDWTLSAEGRAYATAKGLSNGRIEREAERFRDFWLAKPGKDGVKADWEATWRNWVLKVVDRGDLTLGQTAPAAPVVRYYDN